MNIEPTDLMGAALIPLRLASNPQLIKEILGDPLLFAAHYAIAGRLGLVGNDKVAEIKDAIGARYDDHDEMLKLIERLRGQMPTLIEARQARHLAEGMEARNVIHAEEYIVACLRGKESIERIIENEADRMLSVQIKQASNLFGFSEAEKKLLSFALFYAVVPDLALLTRLVADRKNLRNAFWTTALSMSTKEIASALNPTSKLVGSGLLDKDSAIPRTTDFWTGVLVDGVLDGTGVFEELVPGNSVEGAPRIPRQDLDIIIDLLQKKGPPGINVLLYGKASVDKLNLAHRIVAEIGGTPYVLDSSIPDGERQAAVILSQHLLRKKAGRPVLVIPKAHNILTRTGRGVFYAMFGFSEGDEEVRPIDEKLLSENQVPTLWITHDASKLHNETLARFLFHAEALRGTRRERSDLIGSVIAGLPIDEEHKVRLAQLEGVSAQQLTSAKTLADISHEHDKRTYAATLVAAVIRSQKAMSRRTKDDARAPITKYSLDYVNSSGRFGPAHILKALRNLPAGSLCLYGLPGTGKTQFAEHIASELGKPILIKRASDIYEKWLGDSEKKISEMFHQAEEEDAILLLDEADSFLRDRARGRGSWEVTTVNELLQHMERFDNIFICTTNLFQQIDPAALRRFTFKLEFLPLTVHQRFEMFLNESGLRGKTLSEKEVGSYEDRLALMKNLTPGDFATVKRQCVLLGEVLSPEEWLLQLEIEVRAKSRLDSETELVAL